LDVGQERITEVSAIMTFLALSHPASELLDSAPLVMSRSLEWMSWLASVHAAIVSQVWRTERFSDDPSDHKNIQLRGMKNLNEVYSQINAKLDQSDWAVGAKFSIPDPYLLVFFRWGNRLGINMNEFAHWVAHAKKMEKRESVQRVLSAEGISIWR